MKRFVTRALIVVAATLGIVFAQVVPASATVHEIVGQWCSGQEPLGPPGISGGSNADNFAKPLNASGFVTDDSSRSSESSGPGLVVVFNYDNPNAKVVATGVFVVNRTASGWRDALHRSDQARPQLPGVQALPEVGDWLTALRRTGTVGAVRSRRRLPQCPALIATTRPGAQPKAGEAARLVLSGRVAAAEPLDRALHGFGVWGWLERPEHALKLRCVGDEGLLELIEGFVEFAQNRTEQSCQFDHRP